MFLSISEKVDLMKMWNELSDVLGLSEFCDPTSPVVTPDKAVKDFQEIDDELKRRRELIEEERPRQHVATRPWPKGYRYPQGMGIARAIKEERIGTPIERFECFYEAETEVIQEAVKEHLGVPGYMSYRDACNQINLD